MKTSRLFFWLWIAGLLLVPIRSGYAAVWQWSVPVETGRAFLWIPPNCEQVRGVVVAQNNMIEQGILEHASFRDQLQALGLAEVFIAPPFDVVFQFDQDAGEKFNHMMDRLAEASGYTELNVVPVVPMGHSACASFSWNFAAWNPARTLAILSIHGDAPLTNLPGSGHPNPDWGDRSIDGIPGLMVMGEYEWGDEAHGVDRLTPALVYKNQHPNTPIAMLAEPGEGHFNYCDALVDFLAMFIRKAAEARLPKDMPLDRGPELVSVDPSNGWLVQRWHLNQPRTFEPAAFSEYAGDPEQAFWAMDQEMAWAIHNYKADQPGKLPQLLSITVDGVASTNGCGEPVALPFLPDSDGITFHLKTSFLDLVPGSETHNRNAARWAGRPAGATLGHAAGGGPIVLHRISGPVIQTGTNMFQYSMDRVNSTGDRRGCDIWIWASHPGDEQYKSMVQQARIRVPRNTGGREQKIDFPAISDITIETNSLLLSAVSDAGLPVSYYVLEGPAEVDGNSLRFSPIPPRSRFPVRVTVVAWQHGIPNQVQTAEPVSRPFFIYECQKDRSF